MWKQVHVTIIIIKSNFDKSLDEKEAETLRGESLDKKEAEVGRWIHEIL